MAIQILQLRPSVSNPEKLVEKGFERKWRVDSVQAIFSSLEDVLKQIPQD